MERDALFVSDHDDPLDDDDDGDDEPLSSPSRPQQTKPTLEREEKEGLSVKALAYDGGFVNIRNSLQQIGRDILGAVNPTHRTHRAFQHLVNHVEAHLECSQPAKRRINVLGRTGVGKSSLLNAILCSRGLARSGSTGGSCTHLPTFYCEAFGDQKEDFAVRVRYVCEAQILKMLRQIIRDWRHAYFDGLAHASTQNAEVRAEKQSAINVAQTGKEALRSMLCDRFGSDGAITTWLDGVRDKPLDGMLDEIFTACRNLLPTGPVADMSTIGHDAEQPIPDTYLEFNDEQGLLGYLNVCAFSDKSYRNSTVWPLVQDIHVAIRGVPLLQYATFVDLPGSGDTNVIRANVAAEHSSLCDEVWLVADIGRIVDDESMWRSLTRYAGIKPCTIIATHIDLSLDAYATPVLVKQQNVELDTHRLQHILMSIDTVRMNCEKIEVNMDRKQKAIERGWVEKNHKRRILDGPAIAARQRDLQVLRLELKRNRDEESELAQGTFQEKVSLRVKDVWHHQLLPKLQVHFPREWKKVRFHAISSTHYLALKGVGEMRSPTLSLESTGVPGLRCHVLATHSLETVRYLKQYMNGPVALAVNGTGLCISEENAHQCLKVLTAVKSGTKRFERSMLSYKSEIEPSVEAAFLTPMKREQVLLAQGAVAFVDARSGWHPSSLGAFIRRRGTHGTRARPWHSWDDQYIEGAVKLIMKNWGSFVHSESDAAGKQREAMLREIRELASQSDKRTAPPQLADRSGEFDKLIETQLTIMAQDSQNIEMAYKSTLREIKIDAIRPSDNTSYNYINYIMAESYEECAAIRGKGYRKNVLAVHRTKLKKNGERSPFAQYGHSIRQALDEATNNKADAELQSGKDRLDDIWKWLNAVFAGTADFDNIWTSRQQLTVEHAKAAAKLTECRHRLMALEKAHKRTEAKLKQNPELVDQGGYGWAYHWKSNEDTA